MRDKPERDKKEGMKRMFKIITEDTSEKFNIFEDESVNSIKFPSTNNCPVIFKDISKKNIINICIE